jgi:hypothetical protein
MPTEHRWQEAQHEQERTGARQKQNDAEYDGDNSHVRPPTVSDTTIRPKPEVSS